MLLEGAKAMVSVQILLYGLLSTFSVDLPSSYNLVKKSLLEALMLLQMLYLLK